MSDSADQVIPRIIHYCWFGGAPLGEKERRCIASWKEFFPGYEIRRWDEDNFDVDACAYVREAYDGKRWAFVSDYARFKILHDEGGLYFDTDVEVIASFDDILEHGGFLGCEDREGLMINAGLGMAAVERNPIFGEILADYEAASFIRDDGSIDETTVVNRVTRVFERHGFDRCVEPVEIGGLWIYPSTYFNPKNIFDGAVSLTPDTRSIHHFSMSWVTGSRRVRYNVRRWMARCGVPEGVAAWIAWRAAAPWRFAERLLRRVHEKNRGVGNHG